MVRNLRFLVKICLHRFTKVYIESAESLQKFQWGTTLEASAGAGLLFY